MKSKVIGAITLIIAVFIFCLNGVKKDKSYKVIEVRPDFTICIDTNFDNKCGGGELFELDYLDTFPIFEAKKLGLTYEQNKKLGGVSNAFLKELLENKEIKFENDFPKYPLFWKTYRTRIFVDNIDVIKLLLEKGYAVSKKIRSYNPYGIYENKALVIKNANKIAPNQQKFLKGEEIEKRVPDGIFGSIEVYFVNPRNYKRPSKKARTAASRAILHNIENAKTSLDIAIYGIEDQKEIYTALLNAKKRGVKVRIVVDSNPKGEDAYKDTKKLRTDFDAKSDNHPFIMHNKFFIVDNKKVIVSTLNISPTGSGGYNSNTMLIVNNAQIAKVYLKEFNQMYEGKFHKEKEPVSLENLVLDKDTTVSVYFSPAHNIYEKKIRKVLTSAKNEILISAFYLTHRGVLEDLVRAKEKGVNVKIILDATGAANFKERHIPLRLKGIKIKVENWGGKNHQKDILADGCTLITGSANISRNAYEKNDENIMVIKNCALGKLYKKEFEKLYNSIDDKYLTKIPKAEGFESEYSCFDGIDNDYDGKIDSKDSGCMFKK